MVNAKGEVVGLIFDGNIHSLGGDYGFDETKNRAVAVHSAADPRGAGQDLRRRAAGQGAAPDGGQAQEEVILGHLTVTAAGHRLVRAVRGSGASPCRWAAARWAPYLPDLVDKPIALVTGLSGRGYGHSLVVQLAVFGAGLGAAPPRPRLLAALAHRRRPPPARGLGAGLVLLAPLLGPIPYIPRAPLWEKHRDFYTGGRIQVWLEVAAVLYWIAVALTRDDDAELVTEPPRDPA